MKLNRNEVMLLRGILYTKRMYKDMKHIPHGVVIWEDWMEDSFHKINNYIKEHYPDIPDWK
tara:strand:+ start:1694 stop:1876 length:183 start_codon:yes stop_codon:yes gene_type:complete